MFTSTSQTVTKRWFYLRIFACFWMLSILLVLLLSLVSYSISSNLLKKEINHSNRIILEYLQNNIDSSLSSIKKDAISYCSFDPSVNSFVVNSDPASGAYLSSIICKDLSQMKSVNPYIRDIVFYSRNKDYVITAEGSTKSSFYFDLYPENHFESYLDSAMMWESFYINSYQTATLTFDAVIFCTTLPANSVRPSALLCIALDKRQLWNDVNSFNLTQNGFVLITDQNDNVILNYSPESLSLPVDKETVQEARRQSGVSIGNTRYLSIPVTSPNNGWNYIALIPYSEISSKTSAIQYTSFFLCIAMTAVSLLLSFAVSRRLYAPVSALVRNVAANRGPSGSGSPEQHDEFSFIQTNFNSMLLENQDLQDSPRRYIYELITSAVS